MLNKYKIREYNPIMFRSFKLDHLKKAKELMLADLEKWVVLNNIPHETKQEIKNLIEQEYLRKMLSYYIESKLTLFSDYINHSFKITTASLNEKIKNPNIIYLKHTKELLMNEHY